MNTRPLVWLSVSLILFSLVCSCGATKMTRERRIFSTITINAKSNIFRAGAGDADENGGGQPAPSVSFSAEAGNVLRFSKMSGTVSCCGGGEAFNDADGGTFAGGVTDVESAGGISGITHPNKTIFLVGVFTDNSTAQPPGPDRLDATSAENLRPRLFQTFFIGTGKGKEIQVP